MPQISQTKSNPRELFPLNKFCNRIFADQVIWKYIIIIENSLLFFLLQNKYFASIDKKLQNLRWLTLAKTNSLNASVSTPTMKNNSISSLKNNFIFDMITFSLFFHTLGEESLAGRNFSGKKIWRNWREFNLAGI